MVQQSEMRKGGGGRPYRLPTHELPTGRQFKGRHFMVHQSTELPTLIMKTYFDMFWRVKQCF